MAKDIQLAPIKRMILKHVDCYDLLDYYGEYRGPRRDVFVFCPFHTETKPSARVYTSSGLIYCFGCKILIDPLSYAMKQEELMQNGAIAFLEKNFGFKLDLDNINKLDYYEDTSEIDRLSLAILQLRFKIPFKDYHELWKSFDQGYLTESVIKNKRDFYRC